MIGIRGEAKIDISSLPIGELVEQRYLLQGKETGAAKETTKVTALGEIKLTTKLEVRCVAVVGFTNSSH